MLYVLHLLMGFAIGLPCEAPEKDLCVNHLIRRKLPCSPAPHKAPASSLLIFHLVTPSGDTEGIYMSANKSGISPQLPPDSGAEVEPGRVNQQRRGTTTSCLVTTGLWQYFYTFFISGLLNSVMFVLFSYTQSPTSKQQPGCFLLFRSSERKNNINQQRNTDFQVMEVLQFSYGKSWNLHQGHGERPGSHLHTQHICNTLINQWTTK